MTDIERSALSKDDPEYTWRCVKTAAAIDSRRQVKVVANTTLRIAGSKIQVAGWTTAATLLWTLKLCMVYFYLRLTVGLCMSHTWLKTNVHRIGLHYRHLHHCHLDHISLMSALQPLLAD
jgi:hypothetical protein